MSGDQRLDRQDLWLLVMVTFSWGLSFPIIKSAVTTYPPLAFRTICLLIGMVILGLHLVRQRTDLRVPSTEWMALLKVVLVTMTLWQIGLMYGVKMLNGGRAAIIGYTFPVWALIGSILFYKAKVTWRSIAGVMLAIGATALLALSELDRFVQHPMGILVMLGAAMAWGFGTAITRHTPLSISNQLLAWWSLVITLAVFTPLTLMLELPQLRVPSVEESLAMLYGGIVTFVFCYIAWFRLSRKLPAAISGLSIMLVPPVGVMTGALFFDEVITIADVAALALIIMAMLIVLRPAKSQAKT